jgi:hypothetical protein
VVADDVLALGAEVVDVLLLGVVLANVESVVDELVLGVVDAVVAEVDELGEEIAAV